MDKQGNNGKNGHTPPSGEIDYYRGFKNHVTLMEGYKSVLKNSISTTDRFCRTKFVESHIYKKLKIIRKIYSVEIATLPDSDTHRQTLNNLVENIDKFQRDLSYFPNITTKEVISIIVPILAAIGAIYSLSKIWSPINAEAVLLGIFLLSLLVFYCAYCFVLAVFSFVDKRLLFIFPEYKLFPDDKRQRGSDKWKKRWKAFSGKEIEGTIYEKENELFKSLKMIKIAEQDVDIALIMSCISIIAAIEVIIAGRFRDNLDILVALLFATFLNLFLLIFLLSIFKKRAK
jgi:hypothetical protein